MIDTLITNRTGGYYGIEDLNRVGEAFNYIKARLWACGLFVNVNGRTNWVMTDKVTPTDAQAYLDNLREIRGALAVLTSTPPAPSGDTPFNTQEANDIESILLDVDILLTNMELHWVQSGEIFSGEG